MTVLSLSMRATTPEQVQAIRSGFLRDSECIGIRVSGPGPIVVTGFYPNDATPYTELWACGMDRETLSDEDAKQFLTP